MALSTLATQTRAGTEINVAWIKAQSKLLDGYNRKSEEWGWIPKLKDFEMARSAREMTCPVDLVRAPHAVSIPEGGYEQIAYTPNMLETTVTWSNYNYRFVVTNTARYLDQSGRNNQIIKQFKYQMRKLVEGMSATISRDFYGFSSGVWAKTSTAATSSSTAYTLIDAYTLTETHADQASFLGSFFVVGDKVALVRSGSLVTNAIGTVTAVTPATPTITVNWTGSVSSASADSIVLASSSEGTTIAATSYNRALVGLLEMNTSNTVHSLPGSTTNAEWNVGYAGTTAGRFGGVELRKMRQGIEDNGGGTLSQLIWSRGVSNDAFSSQSGVLRFSDPFHMELDGEATAKGVTQRSTRKVPPGYVFGWADGAIQKFQLLDQVSEGEQVWEDGDKLENQNGRVFSSDYPVALVCTSRRKLAYSNQKTEQ